jgi:hypothetical protein
VELRGGRNKEKCTLGHLSFRLLEPDETPEEENLPPLVDLQSWLEVRETIEKEESEGAQLRLTSQEVRGRAALEIT